MNSLTASTTSSSSTSTSSSTSESSAYETYMTLLLTTLQNQDPTDPEDVSDITDQLATFEQLELSEQNNALLSDLSASLTALQGVEWDLTYSDPVLTSDGTTVTGTSSGGPLTITFDGNGDK